MWCKSNILNLQQQLFLIFLNKLMDIHGLGRLPTRLDNLFGYQDMFIKKQGSCLWWYELKTNLTIQNNSRQHHVSVRTADVIHRSVICGCEQPCGTYP